MEINQSALDSPDPSAIGWADLPEIAVRLSPVPLAAQPNAYIRAAWEGRPYGMVTEVKVRAARAADKLNVLLDWERPGAATGEFTDSAAVFFPPPGGNEPPVTIGTHDEPVTLWLWRDLLDIQTALDPARELLSTGPGRLRPRDRAFGASGDRSSAHGTPASIEAASSCQGSRWRLVLQGDLDTALSAGRMGVAIWDGSNDERAGIGAVSSDWIPLESGKDM